MTYKIVLSCAVALLTSACGGGGGGGDAEGVSASDSSQSVVGGGNASSDSSATARFTLLNTNYNAIQNDLVPQTVVPTSGSAVFAGQIGMDVSGALPGDTDNVDASLVGDLSLTTNFANQTVTGSAQNFIYADVDGNLDESVTGSLSISGSPTNNIGVTTDSTTGSAVLAAVGEGTLGITQGSTEQEVALDTVIVGQFGKRSIGTSNSENPIAVRGFVTGRGSGDLSLTISNGRFAAETANANVFP